MKRRRTAKRRRRGSAGRSAAGRIAALALIVVVTPFVLVGILSLPNWISPRGIVVHHSALGGNADGRADAAVIDAVHERRGWGAFWGGRIYHIGYHYVIRPDGTVEPGRPERCRGAHTRGFNDSLGICVLGNFNDAAPTVQQRRALAALCRRLLRRYDLRPEDVRPHRDCPAAATDCPGKRFPFAALRRDLEPVRAAAKARRPG